MNGKQLHDKVNSAMYTLIEEKGVASPAEVLMAIGVLSKENYERWRTGRVDYLERVCQINLSKLADVNREIRAFAKRTNLKASWTDYHRKTKKGDKIRLRFSKSGAENIERAYATSFVSQGKVQEAAARKDFRKRKDALTQTIAPCGLVCGLCSEASQCAGCRADAGCARADTCYQRKCCAERGIKGCWKCPDFPCGRDMFSPEHDIRLVAFVRCAKEDGPKALAAYLLRNQDNGILYHRDKRAHIGDYDGLGSEDAVLELLRKGK